MPEIKKKRPRKRIRHPHSAVDPGVAVNAAMPEKPLPLLEGGVADPKYGGHDRISNGETKRPARSRLRRSSSIF